jgi:5-formyltetrahydrofolate cyclo-ligase
MEARNALSAAEHRDKSRAILAHLETLRPRLHGMRLGIYWPIRREFDPLPFARGLIAAGGALSLPVVIAKAKPLEFRAWMPGTRMAKGVYDIPYPAECAALAPEALLVPLLGFDDAGFRLGYGAGYYDLTLAAFAVKPLAIGVGFALGRLATIYPQPHDIAMDRIVTEAGIFEPGRGR